MHFALVRGWGYDFSRLLAAQDDMDFLRQPSESEKSNGFYAEYSFLEDQTKNNWVVPPVIKRVLGLNICRCI